LWSSTRRMRLNGASRSRVTAMMSRAYARLGV